MEGQLVPIITAAAGAVGAFLLSWLFPALFPETPKWVVKSGVFVGVVLVFFSVCLPFLPEWATKPRLLPLIVAVFGFIALGIGAIGIHDQKIRSATTGNKELVSASSSAAIDRKLQRLEFLQQRDNPVKLVRFLIRLQRALTPDELGHFRVLLEIIDLGTGDSHPTVWIGARDSYIEASYGGQTTKLDGLQTIVWSRAPDEILQDTYVGTVYGRQIPAILAWGAINNRGPFPTIASFDNKWLHVFVTESLFDKIEYIGFAIDG